MIHMSSYRRHQTGYPHSQGWDISTETLLQVANTYVTPVSQCMTDVLLISKLVLVKGGGPTSGKTEAMSCVTCADSNIDSMNFQIASIEPARPIERPATQLSPCRLWHIMAENHLPVNQIPPPQSELFGCACGIDQGRPHLERRRRSNYIFQPHQAEIIFRFTLITKQKDGRISSSFQKSVVLRHYLLEKYSWQSVPSHCLGSFCFPRGSSGKH